MVRSAVRVVLRARPSDGPCMLNFLGDKKSVSITQNKVIEGRPGAQAPAQTLQFKFDNVLANSSQEEVYEVCATDIVKRALEGYNGTIMAYGQTGAGKTFTMSGGRQSYKQRGIIPRALSHLFSELKAMPDVEARVSVQYLEIYNEALYDLLDITTQPHEINIYENARGTVSINGLRTAAVANEAEAMALLFEGETNRVIGEHQLNRESSRSHSIFMVTLELKPTGEGGGDVLVSKLALVDLAGSERVSKTKSEGLVLREAGHINKSLSILEQVILGLGEKNRDHVPFRSSKLTHVLKNSLGGNCQTVLVACCWSEPGQTDETTSTCRFAQRMMRITCEVSANVQQDSSARVRQLERQVAELQQELAMHDAMAARSAMQYMAYSEAQRADLRRRVLDFLLMGPEGGGSAESIEPLELNSLRHMREILFACRHLYREASHGRPPAAAPPPPGVTILAPSPTSTGMQRPISGTTTTTASRPSYPGGAPAPAGAPPAARAAAGNGLAQRPPSASSSQLALINGAAGVGVTDGREQAGGAGVAPDHARPGSASAHDVGGAAMMERLMSAQGSGSSGRPAAGGAARGTGAAGSPGPPPDKRQALEDYKLGPGSLKGQLLADNRARLRAGRKRAKELGLACNAAKRELDALKGREEQLKRQRAQQQGEGAQVLDAEEYEALMRIKELKGQYKENFNELQVARSEVDYMQGLVEQCSRELVLEFNAWYEATYGVPSGLDFDAALGDDEPPTTLLMQRQQAPHSAYTPPPPGGGRPPPVVTGRPPPSATGSAPPPLAARPLGVGMGGPPSSPGGASTASSSVVSPALRTSPRMAPVSVLVAPSAAGTPKAKPRSTSVPLSSLVAQPSPSAEELANPEALAFYGAQQLLLSKTVGVAHRPGSAKKKPQVPAFGGGAA